MENGMVPVDGGQVYFESSGEGEPIVFIHGFSFNHEMWQPQVDYFAKKYRVITYDMRGFGKSSLPTRPYSHYTDLFQLLKYLKIGKTHVVGLSLGGEMGVDFALTYPKMVIKLVLANSSLGGYLSTVDWRVHAQQVGLTEAKKRWLAHSVFNTTSLPAAVASQLTKMVADYSGWHWLNHDPREKLEPSALYRQKEVKSPTLIISGKQDLEYFQDIAEKYRADIPNCKRISIPGAGHLVNLEKPQQFNKAVADFLMAE